MYIDCKGQIAPEMRETFIRILKEELTEQGITTARLESPPPGELR